MTFADTRPGNAAEYLVYGLAALVVANMVVGVPLDILFWALPMAGLAWVLTIADSLLDPTPGKLMIGAGMALLLGAILGLVPGAGVKLALGLMVGGGIVRQSEFFVG
jgi:hypothetical protein